MPTPQGGKSDHLTVEEQGPQQGCGILGRYPVLAVLGFAITGIGVGVGLSFWDPADSDEQETKDIVLKWLGLLGDLFIRSLKAVVLPLVFVNVVLSVVEMMSLGRTSSIAGVTILLYFLTTVIASVLGLISILCFQSLFDEGEFAEDDPPYVSLGCNADGSMLSENADGSVSCVVGADKMNTQFIIADISKTFVKSTTGARDDISLSDTFYDGVFTKLITSNIFVSFTTANFAAVVVFAIVFGLALGRVLFRQRPDDYQNSTLILFLREIDAVLITLINWIIMLTPFAVFSLIVKAIGSQDDLGNSFSNVGYLMAATILAMLAHFFLVHVGLLFFFTRKNPFNYLKHILPAQTTAFACASSAATIPVTLKSVLATGVVPVPIANFVVPLGATINMDGGAIYFPCACIWLAFLNGVEPTAASYFLLIILATVGSAGTAPVPSASLVLIITAYNTVFGTTGTPNGFEFILAIDWFMDRLRTTLNVTGDAAVTGMVAARCPMDSFQAGEVADEEKMAKGDVVEESDETPEEVEETA
jgi:Na+/H+-dicarboxylate symporter